MKKLPFRIGKFNRRVIIERWSNGKLISSKVRYFKRSGK